MSRQTVEHDTMPITRHILNEFKDNRMTVTINASDLRWAPGEWPRHFYVVGHEGAFNFSTDLRRNGELMAKVYRDSLGYEIIVDND